jgi:hypothetical protein
MYRVALLVALTAGSNLAVAQGPSFTAGGIPDSSPGGSYWLSNYRDAGRLVSVTVESTAPSPRGVFPTTAPAAPAGYRTTGMPTEGGIPDNSPGGSYWLSNYRDVGSYWLSNRAVRQPLSVTR